MASISLILVFSLLLLAYPVLSDHSAAHSPSLPPHPSSDEISPPPATPSSAPSPAHSLSSPPAPPPSDLDSQSPSPAPNADNNSPSPSPSPAPEADAGDINRESKPNAADLDSKDESTGGMSGGQKAGVAVGVIAGAFIVGGGVVVYKKRQHNIQRSQYGYAARRELL
ncbi:hydroxyproline-rich glycoprotein family protein [Salvia divinorum]|uniref:Hydroxyproline-rich glycoprotein family protein n=1 Tax=Salvia divinorum TaxID=28513 RepID=A0ABD1HRK0_SALDI